MEIILELLLGALRRMARCAARRFYGPRPSRSDLDSGTLAKLQKLEQEINPKQLNSIAAVIILSSLILLPSLVAIILTRTYWLLLAAFLLALFTLPPLEAFLTYGRERRVLLKLLRQLGPLKTCPRCNYDVSHTSVQRCPECGEPVGQN